MWVDSGSLFRDLIMQQMLLYIMGANGPSSSEASFGCFVGEFVSWYSAVARDPLDAHRVRPVAQSLSQ